LSTFAFKHYIQLLEKTYYKYVHDLLHELVMIISALTMNLFGMPNWATYIFFNDWMNLRLGAGIDPGINLSSFSSSIWWDSNPQPSNRESSLLTTGPEFCPFSAYTLKKKAMNLKTYDVVRAGEVFGSTDKTIDRIRFNDINQWSISSTFYSHVFHTKVFFLPKSFCQSQNLTREKQCEALSYEKRVHKMLMKLTPRFSQIIFLSGVGLILYRVWICKMSLVCHCNILLGIIKQFYCWR